MEVVLMLEETEVEACIAGEDDGTASFLKEKKRRRVSFAQTDTVHVIPRNDCIETPPLLPNADTPSVKTENPVSSDSAVAGPPSLQSSILKFPLADSNLLPASHFHENSADLSQFTCDMDTGHESWADEDFTTRKNSFDGFEDDSGCFVHLGHISCLEDDDSIVNEIVNDDMTMDATTFSKNLSHYLKSGSTDFGLQGLGQVALQRNANDIDSRSDDDSMALTKSGAPHWALINPRDLSMHADDEQSDMSLVTGLLGQEVSQKRGKDNDPLSQKREKDNDPPSEDHQTAKSKSQSLDDWGFGSPHNVSKHTNDDQSDMSLSITVFNTMSEHANTIILKNEAVLMDFKQSSTGQPHLESKPGHVLVKSQSLTKRLQSKDGRRVLADYTNLLTSPLPKYALQDIKKAHLASLHGVRTAIISDVSTESLQSKDGRQALTDSTTVATSTHSKDSLQEDKQFLKVLSQEMRTSISNNVSSEIQQLKDGGCILTDSITHPESLHPQGNLQDDHKPLKASSRQEIRTAKSSQGSTESHQLKDGPQILANFPTLQSANSLQDNKNWHNAASLHGSTAISSSISTEGLELEDGRRVLADANALPKSPNSQGNLRKGKKSPKAVCSNVSIESQLSKDGEMVLVDATNLLASPHPKGNHLEDQKFDEAFSQEISTATAGKVSTKSPQLKDGRHILTDSTNVLHPQGNISEKKKSLKDYLGEIRTVVSSKASIGAGISGGAGNDPCTRSLRCLEEVLKRLAGHSHQRDDQAREEYIMPVFPTKLQTLGDYLQFSCRIQPQMDWLRLHVQELEEKLQDAKEKNAELKSSSIFVQKLTEDSTLIFKRKLASNNSRVKNRWLQWKMESERQMLTLLRENKEDLIKEVQALHGKGEQVLHLEEQVLRLRESQEDMNSMLEKHHHRYQDACERLRFSRGQWNKIQAKIQGIASLYAHTNQSSVGISEASIDKKLEALIRWLYFTNSFLQQQQVMQSTLKRNGESSAIDFSLEGMFLQSFQFDGDSGLSTQVKVLRSLDLEAVELAYPRMDASLLFQYVNNDVNSAASVQMQHVYRIIQRTNCLFGSLMDMLREVRYCRRIFAASCKFQRQKEKLLLNLTFLRCASGLKLTLMFDMACVKEGVYPSDLKPADVQIETYGLPSNSSMTRRDVLARMAKIPTGHARLYRICSCVEDLLRNMKEST